MNGPKDKSRIEPRKEPKQKRSITRFHSILGSAESLIVEHGVVQMKMTDIAAHAGVPVGSVYQFFPEKAAILKALLDQRLVRLKQDIANGLTGIVDRDDARERVMTFIDHAADVHRTNAIYRELWAGMSLDPELRRVQFRAHEELGILALRFLEPFINHHESGCRESRFLLITMLTGSVLRCVAEGHDKAESLLAEWKLTMCEMLFPEESLKAA
ncbi:TetR/AcrR family transcriptional regulator [Rhizobium paknamense]|uniref:AcrR family transcriptional regulator n=1 Tax=Rhizobium paknamense TaxID=1206817 RepID=A0ABU0I9K9_9HYPH|nr:TetR family transcriptional regulator [Rhizobium paknamense]MDQ0454915.1 AcrR family transcriptional regulator [Rhizobium paknamense]